MEVLGLPIEVVRKDIKNLHLGVYPPDGLVRIAAPLRLGDDAVRLAVIEKLGWINRQRTKFAKQERQSRREMVRGESHYFLGRRYLLNVIPSNSLPRVEISGSNKMNLYIWKNADARQRFDVLQEWYRQQLKELIPPLIQEWENITGIRIPDWRIKQMKTKWGSCGHTTRRIWLNLELVKTPMHCIEFVLVHEMVHLLERRHNNRFKAYMDKLLPQWRLMRDELANGPLGHFDWSY